MSTFWTSFWPDLAATIVGVGLGLPLALWVNRRVIALTQRQQRSRELDQLVNALRSVDESLVANSSRLRELHTALEGPEGVPLVARLRTAIWDATRSQIVPHLRHPTLRGDLASHFEKLSEIARLHALLIDNTVGVASALGSASDTRSTLRRTLLQETAALAEEADRLVGEVRRVIKSRGRVTPRS